MAPPYTKSPYGEKPNPKQKLPLSRLLPLFILLCFSSASFLKLFPFPPLPPSPSLLQNTTASPSSPPPQPPSCSSLIDRGPAGFAPIIGLLCCDRTNFRTDVCYMLGDVRAAGRSLHLVSTSPENKTTDNIRPYTRKWEREIMSTIDELSLRQSSPTDTASCDVRHSAPAVVFSTGGYTGNVYHEFNDGLIPLYITAERFAGEVVLAVVEYHEWWHEKYRSVLEKISRNPIVDLGRDRRVHCFDEVIVGLKIHGELSIDSKLMPNGKGIHDFQALLDTALTTNPHPPPSPPLPSTARHRLKLTVIIRRGSRRLLNLRPILRLFRRSGFDTSLLSPNRSTPLSDIHRSLSATDAVLAVHGAAVTHLLFIRPGSVLIQIVPLGLDWAAETYYGEPARRLGLQYLAYNVTVAESSLSKVYGKNSPVLVDTAAVTRKGWAETKRIYMDKQDVDLDLKRFGKFIRLARSRLVKGRSRD